MFPSIFLPRHILYKLSLCTLQLSLQWSYSIYHTEQPRCNQEPVSLSLNVYKNLLHVPVFEYTNAVMHTKLT